jgi:hypothetical protein
MVPTQAKVVESSKLHRLAGDGDFDMTLERKLAHARELLE